MRVYDTRFRFRLVTIVEIVSAANKDRPETCPAFVARCAASLQERVGVGIVDPGSNRAANLSHEVLQMIGEPELAACGAPMGMYAATNRAT